MLKLWGSSWEGSGHSLISYKTSIIYRTLLRPSGQRASARCLCEVLGRIIIASNGIISLNSNHSSQMNERAFDAWPFCSLFCVWTEFNCNHATFSLSAEGASRMTQVRPDGRHILPYIFRIKPSSDLRISKLFMNAKCRNLVRSA